MTDLTQWPHDGSPPPANPIEYTAAQQNDRKAAEVRAERNTKLSNSDWTQITDATADKTAWAVYRMTLRDITEQAGFPWAVTWPDAP